MNKLLTSNNTIMRLVRTIMQGIIGVLMANMDYIVSGLNFSAEAKALIVALTMAILSPIMAEIGKHTPEIAAENSDEMMIVEAQ